MGSETGYGTGESSAGRLVEWRAGADEGVSEMLASGGAPPPLAGDGGGGGGATNSALGGCGGVWAAVPITDGDTVPSSSAGERHGEGVQAGVGRARSASAAHRITDCCCCGCWGGGGGGGFGGRGPAKVDRGTRRGGSGADAETAEPDAVGELGVVRGEGIGVDAALFVALFATLPGPLAVVASQVCCGGADGGLGTAAGATAVRCAPDAAPPVLHDVGPGRCSCA